MWLIHLKSTGDCSGDGLDANNRKRKAVTPHLHLRNLTIRRRQNYMELLLPLSLINNNAGIMSI